MLRKHELPWYRSASCPVPEARAAAMLPLVVLGVQLLAEVIETVVTKNCPLYFELKHAFMLCCVAKSLRANSDVLVLVKLAKKKRQQGYAQEYYDNLLRNLRDHASETELDEERRPAYALLEVSQYLAYSVRLSDPPVTYEVMIELNLEEATVRIRLGERKRFPADMILTFSVEPRHPYLISGVLTAALDASSYCPGMDFITHFRVPRQMPLVLEYAFAMMAVSFVMHDIEYGQERQPRRPMLHFLHDFSPLIVMCYDGADLVPCMDMQNYRVPLGRRYVHVPRGNHRLWREVTVDRRFNMQNLRDRFDALMAQEAAAAGAGPAAGPAGA